VTRDADPSNPDRRPELIDLKLAPAAVLAAKQGMFRSANGEAGTGTMLKDKPIHVAGKTGSAQAVALGVPKRDEAGRFIYRTVKVPIEDSRGNIVIVERRMKELWYPKLGTHAQPNPVANWYRGTGDNEDRRSHAWYMGYAPAEDPRVAFAVLVEYGGGGGATAGQVASRLIDACIQHGYLASRDGL
jgi:cell division protein FtsI/penicillin-binding protein 2